LISEPSYRRIFQTTFEIAFIVTGLSIVLGYPLAYFISQLRPRMAGFCLVFVILPLWTSVLVRTYAWLVLLQRKGVINETLIGLGVIDEPLRLVNNYTGTVIGMVHVLLPFLILPLYSVMRGIDQNYMKAAASLGASPSRAFWAVFFPLSLLGLLGGAVLVFVLSLEFYITPELLGGGKVMMVSMKIQQNAALYFNWGAASALGVVILVLTMGAFWGLGKLFPSALPGISEHCSNPR
jgi:putative spermidine/putrescine transport system permease protein/spermidine/putrescine transport system permease protein